MSDEANAEPPTTGRKPQFRRPPRLEVNGWVNLDKPVGVTSTQAVARLKRLFNAKKVGHAGTLDPLASGVLPIAFGEATKTVPIVQDGAKAYEFTVRWGVETDTDDAEGRVVATADARPTPAEIEAALPRFVGVISQTPPTFSAIRIAGERAYDLARDGETFEIAPRAVVIHRFALVAAGRASRPTAARAPMCAHWRAISAERWAATAMSCSCAGCGSGRFAPTRRPGWKRRKPRPKRAPQPCCRSKPGSPSCRASPSTATARRPSGAARSCCCAATPTRATGPPTRAALARRSPSA